MIKKKVNSIIKLNVRTIKLSQFPSTATFFNATFEETFRGKNIHTVWDDDLLEVKPWFPTDPIYYAEWEPMKLKKEFQSSFFAYDDLFSPEPGGQ